MKAGTEHKEKIMLGAIGYAIEREAGAVIGVLLGIAGVVLFGRWMFLRKLRRYIE